MSAPAGWYLQADGRERYWDGGQWTAQSREGGSSLGAGASEFRVAPPTPPKNSGTGWLKYGGVGFVGLLVGLIMGAASGSTTEASPPVSTVTLPAPEPVTTTVEVPIESTVTVTAAPTSAPVPAATTNAPPARVTVPDAVGMNYQDAQDLWRSSGLIVGPAVDATGANRLPVLDLNWVVLDQEPAAGEVVEADTVITATVKKFTDD